MAETGEKKIRENSLEEMDVSARLDKDIRVGSPVVYILVGILAAIAVAGICAAFIWKIPEKINLTGIVEKETGRILCFLDHSNMQGKDLEGKKAWIVTPDHISHDAVVKTFADTPLETQIYAEIYGFSAWETDQLLPGDYFYQLELQTEENFDDYRGVLVEVSIVASEKSLGSFFTR